MARLLLIDDQTKRHAHILTTCSSKTMLIQCLFIVAKEQLRVSEQHRNISSIHVDEHRRTKYVGPSW